MKTGMQLLGERVTLDALRKEDAELVVAWRNSPDCSKGFFAQPELTLDGHLSWFERYLQKENDCRFLISAEGAAVGTCSLSLDREFEPDWTLGVMIGNAGRRRKGFASEALRIMLNWGFATSRVHRVTAEVFADNHAAIALYYDLGFQLEGRKREAHYSASERRTVDVLIMGLLAEDWV